MISKETLSKLRELYAKAFFQLRQIRKRERDTVQSYLGQSEAQKIADLKKKLGI